MSKKKKDFTYELERISQKDLLSFRKRSLDLNNYFREHYNYFAEQRKNIFEALLDALRRNCCQFSFNNYQRVTSFKYSLTPLSAQGSILNETGGRFNIGNISPNIPKFSALYIAEDTETAIKEKFQIGKINNVKGLTAEDLALTNEKSFSSISVTGYLEQILDLTDKRNLNDFFKEIKCIKLSDSLCKKAKFYRTSPRPAIKTLNELYNTIFEENYKSHGLLFDIPSNSQILGHIAYEAGIQAIKYPSKFTKKNCLAVYPRNFENSDSYLQIKLEDAPETMKDIDKKMDKDSYKQFI